jgi:hypothetical protein
VKYSYQHLLQNPKYLYRTVLLLMLALAVPIGLIGYWTQKYEVAPFPDINLVIQKMESVYHLNNDGSAAVVDRLTR